MSGYKSSQTGDFYNYFMTTTELIDRYATGGLWGCGYNGFGQLGTNDTTHRSSPIQTIAYGTNWKQVACSFQNHTAAIKTDGTLWMWGDNSIGYLGTNDTTHRSSPTQTVTYGTNWKQVSCGVNHTTAIKTDGTLWGWGFNGNGRLGTNDTTHRSSPIQTIAYGTNWKQVACGGAHVTAIKTDGTLWGWGFNGFGQLGTNDTTDRSSPIQTIAYGTNWKQVSSGYGHTSAIKTDGTLWVWGWNYYGQLGTNDGGSRYSPTQTVTYGTNWKQVACGYNYTVAIKTDGTLWGWGRNDSSQLGTNDITNRSSPIQTIAYGTNWKQVACGKEHTLAIKTDGTLWGWGLNGSGQLGVSYFVNNYGISSPIQTVSYGTNWKQVSGGGGHTVATQYSFFSGVE